MARYDPRYDGGAATRFTQPDTIVPNPAVPQDLNRYSYVVNNPVKYVDPSGHCYGLSDGDATARCVRAYAAAEVATARAAVPSPGAPGPVPGGTSIGLLPGLIPAGVSATGVELAHVGDLQSAEATGQWKRIDDVIEIRAGGTLVRVDNALTSAIASQNAHGGQVLRGVSAGAELLGFAGDLGVIWYSYSTGTTPEDRIDRAGQAATGSALTFAGLSSLSAGCGPKYLLCVGAGLFGTFAGPPLYDHAIDPALEATFSTFIERPLDGLLNRQLGGGGGFDLFRCVADPFSQC